jgi:hypothetical protein
MLWVFYYEIGPGDFVIARRGRRTLAAVGKIIQSAIYAPGKNPCTSHPNFLEVSGRRVQILNCRGSRFFESLIALNIATYQSTFKT